MRNMNISDVLEYKDFYFGLSTFIDRFKIAEDRQAMIQTEPPNNYKTKTDACLLAATVHKLANDYHVPVPGWVNKGDYFLSIPVFAFNTANVKYREYLTQTSPTEFASRNLFFGDNVIERV